MLTGLMERFGWAWQSEDWLGWVWLGKELETVDRAFIECHFEC